MDHKEKIVTPREQVKPTEVQPLDSPKSAGDTKERSSAGVIVLQWLTYVFWGWLIGALILLMGVITSSLIADQNAGDTVAYVIAATVVLLPIAFVVDLFYRRHEPVKKTGAETVIMVIHAVIFALIGIAFLVGTVFIILSMFLEADSGSKERVAVIVTTLFGTILFGAAFLRTLNPFKTRKLALGYGFTMLVVSIVVLGIGVFGPMVKAIAERQDRLIETSLYSVESGIDKYIRNEKRLPDTLNDATYRTDGAKALVKDGLVRYEKVGREAPKTNYFSKLNSGAYSDTNATFRYKLCVTYQGSNESDRDYDYSSSSDEDEGYSSSLSTYRHPAGEVCYKLSTRTYSSESSSDFN